MADPASERYDVSPLGEGKNWVNKVGGLPLFIRAVAHALLRAGHDESEAVQLAIGVIRNWAEGKGKVTPKTRAKAAAALAEWNAKKAASHAGRSTHLVIADLNNAIRHAGPHHLPVKTGHAKTPQTKRLATYRTVDRHTRSVENQMTEALKGLFGEQQHAVDSRLNGRRGQQMLRAADDPPHTTDSNHIFDTAHWQTKTKTLVYNVLRAVAGFTPGHVNQMLDAPKVDDALPIKSVDDFLSQAADRIAAYTTSDTASAIQGALHEGMVAGEGVSGLATRVNEVFGEADRTRAERIARTETQSAVNGASHVYADALPTDVIDHKEWLATPDERTRLTHKLADHQQRPMNTPYQVGGEELMYPGDPAATPDERVNCRCSQIFVPKG